MSSSFPITEKDNGILVNCHIQPSASKTAFVGLYNGALKFSLAAPPVDGKANKALRTFLAKQLRIPKSAVKIQSGEKSRQKAVFCGKCTKADIFRIFKINGV